MGFPVWEVKVKALPVVSIVVPFWGYLIGSILYIWLNQKGTTMEYRYRVLGGKPSKDFSNLRRNLNCTVWFLVGNGGMGYGDYYWG